MTPRSISLVLFGSCTFWLAGCEDIGLSLPSSNADRQPAPINTRVLSGEIERADIFVDSGNAVWDGRPTLGGKWVASTKTQDLERVRITRTDTGQSIEGALFRIEPGTPGPSIVMSSDAARELGFVAGTPTPIEVVALRQKAAETPPASAAVASEAEAETVVETTELAPLDSEATVPSIAPQATPRGSTSALAPVTSQVPTARSGSTTTQSGTPSLAEPSVQPSPVAKNISEPVLQIAEFKTEPEADLALAKLAAQGLDAQKRVRRVVLAKRWIVFTGPFDTSVDLINARKAAAGAGFTEAFVTVP